MQGKCEKVEWIVQNKVNSSPRFIVQLSFWIGKHVLVHSEISYFFEKNFGRLDEEKLEAIKSTMPGQVSYSLDSGSYKIFLGDLNEWLARARSHYWNRLPIWRRVTCGLRGLLKLLPSTS